MKTKHKQQMKCTGIILGTVLIIAAAFSSCKKEKQTPDPGSSTCTSAKYAIMNTTGSFPTQTSYLQTLSNLSISSLGNGGATEIPASAVIWRFDGNIYVSSFGAPATLVKYTLDANCKPVESKRMIVVGANTFSSIEFVSPTKAYASVGGGLARLVVFNPSTMQITGEVDLTSIQKAGSPNVYYTGSAISGNTMFLAVYYSDASYMESYDSCFVAVIDMTTNTVSKLISDARTGMILGNGAVASVFTKDASGDIYVQGMGYTFGTKKVPSGILRIKNGQTNFDPSYFFNLETKLGKDCYGLYNFNGTAFTWRVEDPNDFWCFNGANFKLYKIDLTNAASLGEVSPSIPKSKASQTCPMRLLETNKVYFSVAGDSENAMWVYDLSNGSVSKKFTMVGQCNGIEKLN